MAITKLGSQWKGIVRSSGDIRVESCYDVYADMSGSAQAYLIPSGFCVYSSVKESLSALLPLTIQIRVGSGQTYSFTSGRSLTSGGYSQSGNWMDYYVRVTADDGAGNRIIIPSNGSTFQLQVTITPASGSAIQFTENACGMFPLSLSYPEEIYTGKVCTIRFSSTIPVDANHRAGGSFIWSPRYADYPEVDHIEDLFVDPYTKISDASAGFNTAYFAVDNYDGLPDTSGSRQNGTLTFQLFYLSADFYNGILIAEQTASILTIPRSTIDNDLLPELDQNNTTITCTPSSAAVHGKYVAGYATLEITPSIKFKFSSGANRYQGYYIEYSHAGRLLMYYPVSGSIVVPTYQRGNFAEFTDTYTLVISDRWAGVAGARRALTLTMLGYNSPQIVSFTVHRCKIDSTGDYSYGGNTYAKDDYGAYCLIEYSVEFVTLENTNTKNMSVRYGTTTQTITLSSYTQSGYLVVPANTERTLDVTLKLWDTFTPGGVSASLRLSTAGVLIDFLAGGKGMAVGKVAEYRNTLDINPAWKLLFYQATIGNYQNAEDEDLIAWMHDVDARLTALEGTTTAN